MRLEVIAKTPVGNSDQTPILFIHGAWHAAWCWEYFQAYFAEQGYSSYAMSLRGHGASEGRDRLRWFRLADYVSDLEQVANELLEPPILVGHSLGGFIIQKYFEKHSAPAAVLLASIPVKGSLNMFLRWAWRHPWQMAKCHLVRNSYALIQTPSLAREAFFSAGMPEQGLIRHFARMQEESYLAGWDTVAFDLPRPKRQDLPPMLVLGALDDKLFRPDEIETTARVYHTQAEFFTGMAHDMMLEENWLKVAERILVWLREKGF